MTPPTPTEVRIEPNPVVLTAVHAPAGEKSLVSIYDNGELLRGATGRVDALGLYQNGVQVGNTGDTTYNIYYNNKLVIAIGPANQDSGYTFYMQLRNGVDYNHGTILPNGDYDLVVRYNPNSKNYTVPIRVAVP